ncbi:MAG: hypothetical protein KKD01_10805 [Proteobacteria bacterium]|nr:hypothetical protein [Pseudomonadota bacterium]MBU1418583.1 hypothetical protein [Pseudomonadota bacterium]MBU1455205.1 hypothetical protein [Pseudomonadota bacterium]
MLALARIFVFIVTATFLIGNIPLFSVCSEISSNGIVTAATDKLEYHSGEVIRIVFTNNSHESVFSHIRSLTPVFCIKYIEKKNTDEHWQRLYAQCRFPDCNYEIDAPGEIKPGESETLEWKPLVFTDGTTTAVLPDPGVYRLAISYEDYRKSKWQSVASNTFTLNSGRKK